MKQMPALFCEAQVLETMWLTSWCQKQMPAIFREAQVPETIWLTSWCQKQMPAIFFEAQVPETIVDFLCFKSLFLLWRNRDQKKVPAFTSEKFGQWRNRGQKLSQSDVLWWLRNQKGFEAFSWMAWKRMMASSQKIALVAIYWLVCQTGKRTIDPIIS